MTTEQKKIAVISKIADLQDEKLLDAVNELTEETLHSSIPEAGWGKGLITYVSEDFDDFIPPGFDGNDDEELSH